MPLPRLFHSVTKRLWGGVRPWPHMLAGAALCLLVLVTALFWLEIQRRFPLLPPGEYIGRIQGVIESPAGSSVPLYVKSSEKSIVFAPLASGWKPYRVSSVPKGEGDSYLYPVKIPGPGYALYLIGDGVTEGRFSGLATDLESGDEGTWQLELVGSPTDVPSKTQLEVSHWMRLFREWEDVESDFAVAELRFPQLKREAERLEVFITEGEQAREAGEETWKNAQAEVANVEEEIKRLRAQARSLQEKLRLAQKVTKMGTLVSLAREATERDYRWMRSMLRTVGESRVPADVRVAYEKAQEILELKAAIRKERELLHQLRGRSALRSSHREQEVG